MIRILLRAMMRTALVLARLAALAFSTGVRAPSRVRVIDADTIFHVLSGTRVRLHGIDALERDQDLSAAAHATAALRQRIGTNLVRCHPRGRDRHGRTLATCFVQEQGERRLNLNRWLVEQGHAVAYRRYSRAYVGAERRARAARKGIWKQPFIRPEQWRRSRAQR